tara:strand:- start:118 stop:384 length:267 start_codon:yes stop_codon:yes gene_type:complete
MRVNDKIYYTGDMANCSGWFVITSIEDCKWYGKKINVEEIKTDYSQDRKFDLTPNSISNLWNGKSIYRFIMEKPYKEYQKSLYSKYYS